MLVNSKDILQKARTGGYAVLAPDFFDLDSARCYIQAAEAAGKPIILSFAQVHSQMGVMTLEEAALIGKYLGGNAAVPIVLHLDHGQDGEFVRKAIDLGFTSVMLDASMEDFETNVSRTREVVEYAHARGVTVEAEIGHVGTGENYGSYEDTDSVYTTVEEAVAFVERTGVDSLAVSIGTAHGIYKNQAKPVLNFDRLHALATAVPVPLVLHGGSGSGDDNLRRCAREGIAKINVLTDFFVAAMKQIAEKQPRDYLSLKREANAGMIKAAEHCFRMFDERNG